MPAACRPPYSTTLTSSETGGERDFGRAAGQRHRHERPRRLPGLTDGVGGDGFDVAHDGRTRRRYMAGATPTYSVRQPTGTATAISTAVAVRGIERLSSAVAVDPSIDGTVCGSNANLWQSTNSGATWPKKAPIPGGRPWTWRATNGNNVVVAGRTGVGVDGCAGACTLTTNITRTAGPVRGPGRVDPNDPERSMRCWAGSAGSRAGTCSDDARGTDGLTFRRRSIFRSTRWRSMQRDADRSMWGRISVLRSVDGGASWGVLDDIHFLRAPVFDLVFHRGSCAATFGRGVFSFVKPTGPAIAVGLEDNLAFGTACQGSTHFLTIEASNVGATDLVITSVQRLMDPPTYGAPKPRDATSLAAGEDIGSRSFIR